MVTARNVVGIIGNVISFGLFLSPTPTFIRICKKKDVEEFQFYPYIAAVMNCLFWIFYGLPFVTPDSILVVTINSVGLFLQIIYLTLFCIFDRKNKGRKRVGLALLGEVLFMVAIICITLLVFQPPHRSLFVGVFCDVFNVVMYASPLAITKKVIKTKSVEYMPFWLLVANFCNGGIWFAYALIKLDIFILLSNGLGCLAGAIQLSIYAYYKISTPQPSGEVVKPSEIQLPKSDAASAV